MMSEIVDLVRLDKLNSKLPYNLWEGLVASHICFCLGAVSATLLKMRVSVAAGIVLFVTSVRAFVYPVSELPTAARGAAIHARGQNCAVRNVQSMGLNSRESSNEQRRCQQVCVPVSECVHLWF